jgi:hypothetical protein
MGRPPIGKVAMTNTERSRRYRAGLTAGATSPRPAEPDATKPAKPDWRDREIARLKARIAKLESGRGVARGKKKKGKPGGTGSQRAI